MGIACRVLLPVNFWMEVSLSGTPGRLRGPGVGWCENGRDSLERSVPAREPVESAQALSES